VVWRLDCGEEEEEEESLVIEWHEIKIDKLFRDSLRSRVSNIPIAEVELEIHWI
jgi:hypothetical protein